MSKILNLLSSVRELDFCTTEDLDEVQARHVIYGGDLELAFLELHLLSEVQLLAALSKSSGLTAAEPGYLPIDRESSLALREAGLPALSALPREKKLLVFLPRVPSTEEEKIIGDLLGDSVEMRISSRIRFNEALLLLQDGNDNPRVDRVLSELGPGPPLPADAAPSREPETRPDEEASTPDTTIAETQLTESDDALRPASVRWATLDDSQISAAAETGPPPDDYVEVALSATVAVKRPITGASPRPTYAPSEAADDLAGAKTRDRVIDVLLHFAAQYFDYTAIFAVLPKEARGLRATGTGAATEVVKALNIPLDLPSAFRDAGQSSEHRVTRLRASGLEGGIALDLARPTGKQILLLPLRMGSRTVLLLWGDKGNQDVGIDRLNDLFTFVPLVSEALRSVLRERKRTSLLARAPLETASHSSLDKVDVPNQAPPPPQLDLPQELQPPPSVHERPTTVGGGLVEKVSGAIPVSTSSKSQHRRPTHRGSAAPPASQRTPKTSVPQLRHEVATPEKRSLTKNKKEDEEGASLPPSGFPPEIAKTLRGFPDVKSASEIATSQEEKTSDDKSDHQEEESRAHLTSRRIVPVKESSPASHQGINQLAPEEQLDAPPPPMSERISEQTPRGTLMSRRAAAPEPTESDWEATKPDPIQKPQQQAVTESAMNSLDTLLERYIAGEEDVLGQLIEHGDSAVGALVARFPGPLSEPRNSQIPASNCGPVLHALVELGTKAAPFLTVRTADEDPHIRRWATFVLGEIPGREAAISIASRLLDSAPEVRRAALASARRAQSDRLTRRTIRAQVEGLARDQKLSLQSRCSAIEALADIREHEAIPTLLQLIDDPQQSVARASRWALSVLTRQDFGKDSAAWQKFWQEHRDRDRVEWLIESLDHEKRDLRRAAGEELRSLRGKDFEYDEDSPSDKRQLVQEEFRAWWKNR